MDAAESMRRTSPAVAARLGQSRLARGQLLVGAPRALGRATARGRPSRRRRTGRGGALPRSSRAPGPAIHRRERWRRQGTYTLAAMARLRGTPRNTPARGRMTHGRTSRRPGTAVPARFRIEVHGFLVFTSGVLEALLLEMLIASREMPTCLNLRRRWTLDSEQAHNACGHRRFGRFEFLKLLPTTGRARNDCCG